MQTFALDLSNLASFDWQTYLLMPFLIFLARVCDVSLGTLRIIFVSRGRRNLAPIFGFVEVLIWVVVISELVQRLNSVAGYLAYAAGFAAGNFFGMWLEDRLALGTYALRLIVPDDCTELAQRIHDAGFGTTIFDAHGSTGPVKMIYTIVKRKHVNQVLSIIHQVSPNTFVSVEEVRSTERGFFMPSDSVQHLGLLGRKSK